MGIRVWYSNWNFRVSSSSRYQLGHCLRRCCEQVRSIRESLTLFFVGCLVKICFSFQRVSRSLLVDGILKYFVGWKRCFVDYVPNGYRCKTNRARLACRSRSGASAKQFSRILWAAEWRAANKNARERRFSCGIASPKSPLNSFPRKTKPSVARDREKLWGHRLGSKSTIIPPYFLWESCS